MTALPCYKWDIFLNPLSAITEHLGDKCGKKPLSSNIIVLLAFKTKVDKSIYCYFEAI